MLCTGAACHSATLIGSYCFYHLSSTCHVPAPLLMPPLPKKQLVPKPIPVPCASPCAQGLRDEALLARVEAAVQRSLATADITGAAAEEEE